ncbi:MAG TPA: DUF2079 domain-containing protein [Dehalococcoidia bacterium]|nr:DUF2079 domain-containing protein [Dehalococcoidia bacterium]
MAPVFLEFALITLAAWSAAAAVFVVGRRLAWRFPRRAADLSFYGALAIFAATFAVLGILRHQALNSHSYDLAIYDQVVWNLSQGRWFSTSLEYYFYNFLGDHLSLALAFLAPLYWVYPDPSLLVALQPLAMGLAGVPVYWWARERLGSGLALALGLAYLVYTPMVYAVAIDFHDIVLAAPLLSFATYFMLKGDARRFAITAFPALLVKEEVGLFVAVLGLYWLFGRRSWALGAGTAVLGLAWVLVATRLVIPSFNPEGEYYYLGRYAGLGMSQEGILSGIILRPGETMAQVLTPEKLRYVLHLLTPVGFLPLLGPGLLALALPALGYLLLRGESPAFLVITQYAAPMVPFLFYATVAGIARVKGRGSRVRAKVQGPGPSVRDQGARDLGPGTRRVGGTRLSTLDSRLSARVAAALAAAVLVAAGASYYLHGPGPLSRNFVPERYTISPRAAAGKEIIARIPPQAGVVAQSDLVPQLSRREVVYMFPEVPRYAGVDYILLDREGNRYPLGQSDEAYQQAVAEIVADPEFRLAEDQAGYLLLVRTREPPIPLDAALGGKVRLYGYSLEGASTSGRTLSLYWEVLGPVYQDYSLFIHLLDSQGRRLAQWDGPPTGQHLATSRWRQGARLKGTHAVPSPPDASAKPVRLSVGLYDWKTLERLPVTDGGGRPMGNSVDIQLPPPGAP